MCILIIKPKGKKVPSREILERCFNKNKDGAGFCYNDRNKVIIKKGFMTFNEFYDATKEIPVNSTAFLHCRIGTSGGNTRELTHPYSLCDDFREMKKTKIETDFAVAHNGVFSDLGYEKDVNDTCIFIKKILYPLQKLSKEILNDNLDFIINKCCGYGNKIAIMDKKGNFKKYGQGWKEDDGIFYSNDGYKEYKPITSSYTDYRYYGSGGWCDYYNKNKSKKDYDDYDYIEDYFFKKQEDKTKEEEKIRNLKLKYPQYKNLINDYVDAGYTSEFIEDDLFGGFV